MTSTAKSLKPRRWAALLGMSLLLAAPGCASPPDQGDSSGPSSRAGGNSTGSGGAPSEGAGSGATTEPGSSQAEPTPGSDTGANGPLTWRKANLTNFESYPDPGSEECVRYSGCQWAGLFSFLSGRQPEAWVMMNNIAAVHSKDADTYKLKTLRLRHQGRTIDVTVYDQCSDSDCNGCCSQNAAETGFLIDIEKYTMERFGTGHGVIEWACLDCD